MPDRLLHKQMANVPLKPTNAEVVGSCSLLSALDESDRRDIVAHSFMAYAERGEMIWAAGAPSDFVAAIGSGFAKITRKAEGGGHTTVELMGPGKCIGLFAALEYTRYPANAIAVTNCWYLKVPARVILPIYERSMRLREEVARSGGTRLLEAQRMISRMSMPSTQARVAAVLFMLIDEYGEREPDGVRITLPITLLDLAEMAGCRFERTVRTFGAWQQAGIISSCQCSLCVHDENALLEALRGE